MTHNGPYSHQDIPLMIDVRAISIFIEAGGRLAAMRHCRTPNG
jgi:hypothetical protein